MKFSAKLALSGMALLCVTLSIGGAFSIRQNFAVAKNTALQNSSIQHERTCFALETALSGAETESLEAENSLSASQIILTAEALTRSYADTAEPFAVLSPEGTVFYTTLSPEVSYANVMESIHAGEQCVTYLRTEKTTWALLSTSLKGLSRPLWLTSAWDVTALFSERDRQIQQHLFFSIVTLTVSGAVAALFSLWLTKPLRKLEQASAALAKGDGGARVQIETGDELERLGQSFNHMADALQRQMAELQEESSRQKRFVAAFSHELKTPMTAILGYASMLEKGQLLPELQSKAAGYIMQESKRLEALSRQLLRLMELQSGGIETSATALKPLLQEACDSLPQLSAAVRVDCPLDAQVEANASLLLDFVRNLMLNSAAAEPKDGLIHIECRIQKNGWQLCVLDKGRGIPEQALSKITEPFYRVDTGRARSQGGNGLGLALCSLIAQAHGDHLHIESRVGEGTRVWLVLPFCKDSGNTESGEEN